MAARDQGLWRALWAAMRSPVRPGYRPWTAIGWLILILFLAQIISGILLSFYYQASPDMASESVRFIMRDVDWGWLVRGIHHWASHGILILGLLQIVRTLVSGAYRGPRGSMWIIGFLLLLIFMTMAATGELLPWDDRAYQVTRTSLARVEDIPVGGPALAGLMRGGDEVAAPTLSRAYSAHVLLLPSLAAVLIFLNLWLLSRRSAAPPAS